jgi:hypothetical protein
MQPDTANTSLSVLQKQPSNNLEFQVNINKDSNNITLGQGPSIQIENEPETLK